MAGGHKAGRVSNAATANEVRCSHALTELSPRQWEKKVEGALRANGWRFWHDKDKTRGVGSNPNKTRMAGMPDYTVRKTYAPGEWIPAALARMLSIPNEAWQFFDPDAPFTVVGYVECKTGRGTTTAAQDEWLGAGRTCPGMFAFVARPTNYMELIAALGGVDPA